MFVNNTIKGESKVAGNATLDYSGVLISNKNFLAIFGMNSNFEIRHLVDCYLSNFLIGYFSIDKNIFVHEQSIEVEEDLFNINNTEYYKQKYILNLLQDGIFHLKKMYIEEKICILDIDEKLSMIIIATKNVNNFGKYDENEFGSTHFYIDLLQVSGILKEESIVKYS